MQSSVTFKSFNYVSVLISKHENTHTFPNNIKRTIKLTKEMALKKISFKIKNYIT